MSGNQRRRTSGGPRALALLLPAALLIAVAHACAGPPPSVPNEMPLAGAPPEGDMLPPVPDQLRSRSALQMLLVVVSGLVLVVLLLRLVGRKQRATTAQVTSTADDPFERARKALEELDRRE